MLKIIIIAAPLVMILGICIIFFIAMLGSLSPCGRHKDDDNDPPDNDTAADPNKEGSPQEDPHLFFTPLEKATWLAAWRISPIRTWPCEFSNGAYPFNAVRKRAISSVIAISILLASPGTFEVISAVIS